MNKKSSFSSNNCTNDEDIYKKIKKSNCYKYIQCMGATGPTGPAGTSGILNYADFYALM